MAPLTTATRLAAPFAVAVLLSGCGDGQLTRTFGLVRDTPDEFSVVTRAPLSLPPDYALRPPQPGAPRPQEQSARAEAESALVPDTALLGPRPAGMSPGQSALVRDAGGPAPADIRGRIDQEARSASSDEGFIDKLLYWRKPDAQHAVVNADAEARRLQADAALGQAPTTGETPIIQEKKKGWLDTLMFWK